MAAQGKVSVPENWKFPDGPYHQGPDGLWWYVSPFTGPEPWNNVIGIPTTNLPEGFTDVFGKLPHIRDPFFQEWRDNVKTFVKRGIPPGVSQTSIDIANAQYTNYEMGAVQTYETSNYGWRARWPQSGMIEFEFGGFDCFKYVEQVIVAFQVRQSQNGITLAKLHPFFPLGILEDPS